MSDTTRQYTLATNNDGSGKVKIGLIPERTILYADHLKELEGLRADASWAATHRSELADLRDAFAKAEAQLRSKDEQSAGMRKAKTLCQCGHEKSVHDASRHYPCAVCYCSGFFPEPPALSGPSPAQD